MTCSASKESAPANDTKRFAHFLIKAGQKRPTADFRGCTRIKFRTTGYGLLDDARCWILDWIGPNPQADDGLKLKAYNLKLPDSKYLYASP